MAEAVVTVTGALPDVWKNHSAVSLQETIGQSWGDLMLVLGGSSSSAWELFQAPPVGVGPGASSALALEGAFPNPAHESLGIAFTLPDGATTRLEVFDLAGRVVAARDVGALGPGRHVVRIAEERALAPGLYLVRLTRGTDSRTAKVALLADAN